LGLSVGASWIHPLFAAGSTENSPPLSSLLEQLKKTPASKSLKTLKLADQAYRNGKLDLAIRVTSRLIHRPRRPPKEDTFSDYAHWIRFQVELLQAEKALSQKHYPLVIRQADSAFQSYFKILQNSPMSPVLRTSGKSLASVELLLGAAQWKMHQNRFSQFYFERAFYRLQSQNMLISLTPESLADYAAACSNDTTPSCLTWLDKLNRTFAPKSKEALALTKVFPALLTLIKPSAFRASKLFANYKAPDLDQAAFTEAIQQYFQKDYSKAAQSLQKLLETYPRSPLRARAQYWMGRSLLESGQTEKANSVFSSLQTESPLTYFGLLASLRTTQPLSSAISSHPPQASETDVALLPAEAAHLQRAQALISVDAVELAKLELKELKARDQLSNEFLLYLALLNAAADNSSSTLQIFSELGQRGYEGIRTTTALGAIFPLTHYKLIEKYATLQNLDPLVVLSLVKQESAFDEGAGSSVGALGLMQIMPTTALETDSSTNVSKLHDIEENLRLGTTYLKKLLDRYSGNIALSLAAYNAGPNAVDRWIKAAGPNRDLAEFIELIPYKETREYVAAIIRNYFWYTYQKNGTNMNSLDYFWKQKGLEIQPSPSPTTLQNENA
jgi:soluble lytic murein transglycosylase-like protein